MTISHDAYGSYFLTGVILSLAIMWLTFIVAMAKGVDISTRRFGMLAGVTPAALFLILPYWLVPVSVYSKILMTILAPLAGIGQWLLLENLSKTLWGAKKRGKKQPFDQ